MDDLLDLTIGAEDAFSMCTNLRAAFLDVDSAFQSVNSKILLNKLAKIYVSTSILNYVRFSTYKRYIL